jgi:hypothetical protein
MTGLTKHRLARDVYALDFAAELAGGETLQTIIATRVAPMTSGGWGAAVTADFVDGDTTIVGTEARVTLEAAGDDTQPAGRYGLEIEVETSTGRVLVGHAPLTVTAEVVGNA